jgi:hypothetical protein
MSAQKQISSASNTKVRITAQDFARKVRSKQEVYHFLTHELGAYLPSYDNVTVWHMRDLVSGKRLRLQAKKIKHLNVPQYEGLKLEAFFQWAHNFDVQAKDHRPIMDTFPLELQEREKFPRQYVINAIYTLAGQPFRAWVDELVDRRHLEIAEQKQLYIELDPEVAEIFNQSKAVSTSQGSSYNLMKASAKRRRSKKQIQEEALQEETQQQEIRRKIARIEEMEAQYAVIKQKADRVDAIDGAVVALKASGLLKQTGEDSYQPVQSFQEHQNVLQEREDEVKLTEQLSQQNQQLGQHGISQERQRPSQQLELNEQFHEGANASGRPSVILIDHPEGEDQMMGDANGAAGLVPQNWPFNRTASQQQQDGSSFVDANAESEGAVSKSKFDI